MAIRPVWIIGSLILLVILINKPFFGAIVEVCTNNEFVNTADLNSSDFDYIDDDSVALIPINLTYKEEHNTTIIDYVTGEQIHIIDLSERASNYECSDLINTMIQNLAGIKDYNVRQIITHNKTVLNLTESKMIGRVIHRASLYYMCNHKNSSYLLLAEEYPYLVTYLNDFVSCINIDKGDQMCRMYGGEWKNSSCICPLGYNWANATLKCVPRLPMFNMSVYYRYNSSQCKYLGGEWVKYVDYPEYAYASHSSGTIPDEFCKVPWVYKIFNTSQNYCENITGTVWHNDGECKCLDHHHKIVDNKCVKLGLSNICGLTYGEWINNQCKCEQYENTTVTWSDDLGCSRYVDMGPKAGDTGESKLNPMVVVGIIIILGTSVYFGTKKKKRKKRKRK